MYLLLLKQANISIILLTDQLEVEIREFEISKIYILFHGIYTSRKINIADIISLGFSLRSCGILLANIYPKTFNYQ